MDDYRGAKASSMDRMTFSERMRERAKRLPVWFHAVINLGAVGLAVTWWVSYTGPYRWFAELQLDRSGEYDVKFTGIMVLFACVLSATLVTQIAASLVPDRSESEKQATAAMSARMDAFGNWMARNHYLLAMTGAVVGLAGVGGFMLIQVRLSGRFVTVAAASLERGGAPAGSFARLEGRQLWDQTVGFKNINGDSPGTKTIVPVVSPGWQPGQPVALFARIDDSELQWLTAEKRESGKVPTLSGLLTANDLEGIARTELAEEGIAIAGRHFVLDQGVTPEFREGLGKILLGVSAVLAPVVVVVWRVKRRRRGYAT